MRTRSRTSSPCMPGSSRRPRRNRRAGRGGGSGSARRARCTSSTKGRTRRFEVPAGGAVAPIVAEFETRYARQYGFLMPGRALVIEAAAVEAVGRTQSAGDERPAFAPRPGPLAPLRIKRVFTGRRIPRSERLRREDLRPGDLIDGPAVIREPNATTVIEPGWRATLTPRDHVVLERVVAVERAHALGTTADPVLLEVFNNLFMAIAEQMGVTLANTAYSVKHQGATRLLVRDLRRRRQPDRQRAAHARAPGLDGREREDGHRAAARHDAARRRVRAECPLQRRHASS